MSRPTVSCIIAVYNGRQYLGEAIGSLLAQSRPPDEIIVVNNDSSDATGAMPLKTVPLVLSGAATPRVSCAPTGHICPISPMRPTSPIKIRQFLLMDCSLPETLIRRHLPVP